MDLSWNLRVDTIVFGCCLIKVSLGVKDALC